MAALPRILVVDDHPVSRLGVVATLQADGGFAVCAEAADAEAAREAARRCEPDAAVVDLCLGGRDGLELVSELAAAHPSLRILVFSAMDERLAARRALRAGAHGYLMKQADIRQVPSSLRTILQGGWAVSEATRLAPVGETASLDDLSNQELHIFRLIGQGRSTAAIAGELELSAKTVGSYRERIKAKLSLESAADLERSAYAFAGSDRSPINPA